MRLTPEYVNHWYFDRPLVSHHLVATPDPVLLLALQRTIASTPRQGAKPIMPQPVSK